MELWDVTSIFSEIQSHNLIQRLHNSSFGLDSKCSYFPMMVILVWICLHIIQWECSVYSGNGWGYVPVREPCFPSCSYCSTGTTVSRPALGPSLSLHKNELLTPWLTLLHRHPGGTTTDCCTEPGKTGHQQILWGRPWTGQRHVWESGPGHPQNQRY